MTKKRRLSVAYWFFLLSGMAGIVKQFFIDGLTREWYIELGITALFAIFILQPMTLIRIYDDIRNVLVGGRKAVLKTTKESQDVGGGGTDEDGEV